MLVLFFSEHQDSKIHPLRDPGDSPISGEKFMFSGINKQLSEMRNANSKTDKKGTGMVTLCHFQEIMFE